MWLTEEIRMVETLSVFSILEGRQIPLLSWTPSVWLSGCILTGTAARNTFRCLFSLFSATLLMSLRGVEEKTCLLGATALRYPYLTCTFYLPISDFVPRMPLATHFFFVDRSFGYVEEFYTTDVSMES